MGPAPKILVIDDSELVHSFMEHILTDYQVVSAASGRAGLDRLAEEAPDLVLLDVMMPGELDGFEVCRRIKAEPANRDLAVIFLTSKAEATDKVRGLEMGAVDYITKPFDPAEVLARVRTHLQIHHLNRSLEASNTRLAEALAELKNKKEAMERELEAAAAVQQALLPKAAPETGPLIFDWSFWPSSQVAGDLLDFYMLDETTIGFYLIDVSGHGVASGLMAASVHQALIPRSNQTSLVREWLGSPGDYRVEPPEKVIAELEESFPFDRFDKYFTIFYGLIDSRAGRLTYTNAGHPPPLLLQAGDDLVELDSNASPVGLGIKVAESTEVPFGPGDKLLVYSDGLVETRDARDEPFGPERLRRVVEKSRGEGVEGLLGQVLARFRAFVGQVDLLDDVTCLGLGWRAD